MRKALTCLLCLLMRASLAALAAADSTVSATIVAAWAETVP